MEWSPTKCQKHVFEKHSIFPSGSKVRLFPLTSQWKKEKLHNEKQLSFARVFWLLYFFFKARKYCFTQFYTLLNEIYKVDKKDPEKHRYLPIIRDGDPWDEPKLKERGQLKRKGERHREVGTQPYQQEGSCLNGLNPCHATSV